MHLDGSTPPTKKGGDHYDAQLGVPVVVTEFDVNMTHVGGAQTDRDMLEAWSESGVRRSFTVWGIGDKYSWLEAYQSLPNADATMYNVTSSNRVA